MQGQKRTIHYVPDMIYCWAEGNKSEFCAAGLICENVPVRRRFQGCVFCGCLPFFITSDKAFHIGEMVENKTQMFRFWKFTQKKGKL